MSDTAKSSRMFSNNNRRRAIIEIEAQRAKAKESGDYQTADILELAENLIRGKKIRRNTARLLSFMGA